MGRRRHWITKFEGIRVFSLSFGHFKRGAAVTIPGIGIFVGSGDERNLDLLRHEFGHILQYRQWGFWNFWRHVACASLRSARAANRHRCVHQHTWTEWSANRLSYQYFRQPPDWNRRHFPIAPPASTADMPAFAKNTFTENDAQEA